MSKALSSTLGISDIRSGVENFHHGRGLLKIGEGLAKFVGTVLLAEDLLVSPFVGGRSLLMRGARRAAPSLQGNSLLAEGIPRALGYGGRRGYQPLANAEIEMAQPLTRMQHLARQESERLGLSRHGLYMTEQELVEFAPSHVDAHFELTDNLIRRMQTTLPGHLRFTVNSYGMVPSPLEDDNEIVRRFINSRLNRRGGRNVHEYITNYRFLDLEENNVTFNEPIGRQFQNIGLARQYRVGGQLGRDAYQEVRNATPKLQALLHLIRQGRADIGEEQRRQALRNLTRRDVWYALRLGPNGIYLPLTPCAAVGYGVFASLMYGLINAGIESTKKPTNKKIFSNKKKSTNVLGISNIR